MKAAAEVREVVVVSNAVIETADFRVFDGFVESHFRLGGFCFKRRVPSAAIGTAEAGAERVGVSEGSVDHTVVRHVENEFVNADSRQQSVLGEETAIGGMIQVEKILQVMLVGGDASENALETGSVFRQDQPVRVVLANQIERRKFGQIPPRRASSSARTVCIAVMPPRFM